MNLRSLILPISIIILLFGCKNSTRSISKKNLIKLDFTYSLPVGAVFYSLKFTPGDTVYIKEYFQPQTDTLLYAILNKEERLKIDSIITNIDLSVLDTLYESHAIDGDEYNLNIAKNDTLKTINIYGGGVPNELTGLIGYIIGLKTKLKPRPLDKK